MARPGQRRGAARATVGVPQVCFRDSRTLRLENRSKPASPSGQDTVVRQSSLERAPAFLFFPRPHTRSRSHNHRAQRQAGTQHAPCAFSFLCRRGERVMIAALRSSTGRCSRWTSRETYSCAVASPSGTDRAPLTLCAARAWRSLRSLFVCLFACCRPK